MKINKERRSGQVAALSDVLMLLCERNNRRMINTPQVTRFHATQPPKITIKAYLERIAMFSHCSEECFVLALIYIDRLILTSGNFLVNSFNVHRLVITSVMVAAKFFDDQYFNNAHYGRVGGVSCEEINQLEVEFLFMINFNLSVEKKLYTTYDERLVRPRGTKSIGKETKTIISVCKKPFVKVVSSTNSQKGGVIYKQTPSSESLKAIMPVEAVRFPKVNPAHTAKKKDQSVLQHASPFNPASLIRLRHYPMPRCTTPSYPLEIVQASERIHIH